MELSNDSNLSRGQMTLYNYERYCNVAHYLGDEQYGYY